MGYYEIGLLAEDRDFLARCTACASVEIQAHGHDIDGSPEVWVLEHRWVLSAVPGFGDAYSSAVVAEVDRPGKDPAVITDGMILSAVQSLLTEGA